MEARNPPTDRWPLRPSKPDAVDSLTNFFRSELLHELNESIHPLFREGIVDGSAQSAHRSMAFETVEAGRGRLLDELLFEFLAGKTERHVHARARILLRVATIEAGPIDLRIQFVGLSCVRTLDRVQASLTHQPRQHEPHNVD